MRGLRICKYYSKILKNYELNNAMYDSLVFSANSEESKLLIELAENKGVKTELYQGLIICHCSRPLSISPHNQRLLFTKMVADVLSNIGEIKSYIKKHRNILKYHRIWITPELVNLDFLREGNFIKVKGKYYNVEIIYYIISNEKKDNIDYNWLFEYIMKSPDSHKFRNSYIYKEQCKILDDIVPYIDLSISKENREAVDLLCKNTLYNELAVNMILEAKEGLVKGFKFYYPMNDYYLDKKWLEYAIISFERKIETKLNKGIINIKAEEIALKRAKDILADIEDDMVEKDYIYINSLYRKYSNTINLI